MVEPGAAELAELAALLADRTRAAMCLALLDARAWTVGELARHVGVAPSTATEHADRLLAGGLLAQEKQGRHRYLRLAGSPAAALVESLGAHAAPPTAPVTSLRTATVAAALRHARTCYDHLAGQLGVGLTDALTGRGVLGDDCALTDVGLSWLDSALGIDVIASRGRRPLARACLDWTERRPHLAGSVGAHLCRTLLDRGWITRVSGTRAVRLTGSGRTALPEVFGVDPSLVA